MQEAVSAKGSDACTQPAPRMPATGHRISGTCGLETGLKRVLLDHEYTAQNGHAAIDESAVIKYS
jgi:hypothetical protein